ncbi:zinc ABC transporter substrate-binding protein [Candidatus Poribacteria bacterium]|nr:zinc ABC transporter substrate-binding protein [Candidatus Poribacteria bacterium]
MMNKKEQSERATKTKRCLIFSMVVALFLCLDCSKPQSSASARLKVAATIFPLYDIIRNVVGDKIEVIEILPPGASPHTFDLRPQQVLQLRGARIVFRIGHGLDDWTDAIVEVLPDVKRVVVDKGVRLIEAGAEEHGVSEEEGHGHEAHRHAGVNPHYWLSISNGKIVARNVAEEIIRLDPSNESYYRANMKAYESKLDAAKQEIDGLLRNLPNKKIITFHDAWPYYAEEFGLEIVGSFEPFPGKQPTPRYLAELQKKIQENNVKALFSEPQLSSETIVALANDMGLKLYVLDPEGGSEGRESYIELLKHNAEIIAEALSDGK